MYMVLPQSSEAKLEELVDKITPSVLNKHLWLLQELPADLMIPKFKFDFTGHLADHLQEVRGILKDRSCVNEIVPFFFF